MERDSARQVRMAGDEGDDSSDFRLAGRERTRAVLLMLLPPVGREIAVEIQALFVRLNMNRRAVVVLQRPFRQHAVILSAGLGGIAADQKPRLFGMRFPGTIRIRYP